jgi:hypothetical protein
MGKDAKKKHLIKKLTAKYNSLYIMSNTNTAISQASAQTVTILPNTVSYGLNMDSTQNSAIDNVKGALNSPNMNILLFLFFVFISVLPLIFIYKNTKKTQVVKKQVIVPNMIV